MFIVIGEYGIYIKKIKTRWIDLSDDYQVTAGQMDPLLELNPHHPLRIVSVQMNVNETIFSVGYSDLELKVYEIEEDSNSTSGYKLTELHKINFNNEDFKLNGEDPGEIRSIGITPYSDFLIFSPNRLRAIKLNRRTGEQVESRAFLDSTRHVVCPVATFKHKDNPHSPNRVKREFLSEKNFKIGTAPRCILTGHHTPTNVVIDWTNFQPVSYWNLGLMGGYPDEKDNIIHSMTFFGGIPSPSMYIFTTRKPESFIYLVSTVYSTRHLHMYYDYQKAGSKEVNWVNGTLYVAIYIKDSTSTFPAGKQLGFIRVFASRVQRAWTRGIRDLIGKEVRNYHLAKIFLEIGAEDENESFSHHEHLDEFYLGYSISSNSLQVESSILPWDDCKTAFANETKASGTQTFYTDSMLYGRYRFCHFCLRGLKATAKYGIRATNRTVVQCQLEQCEPVKGVKMVRVIKESVFKHTHLEEGFSVGLFPDARCVPVTELEPSEVGFANNKGCPRNYNLDPFRVCRACRPDAINHLSNCFFFVTKRWINEDYTMNIQNYTVEFLTYEYPFKGHTKVKKSTFVPLDYKDLYFKTSTVLEDDGLYGTVGEDFGEDSRDKATAWMHQTLPGSELCYRLISKGGSSWQYLAKPVRGFRLEPMEKYDWIDSSLQKEKYPNGTLNKMICVMSCPIGMYYEFKSLSCRKCAIGCGKCHRQDKCDLCVAGYNKIKNTTNRKLGDKEIVGQCLIGCQEGFYRRRFNGDCLECPKGCKYCRDRSTKELEMLTEEEKEEVGSVGFCLICEPKAKKEESKTSQIAHQLTGICVENCKQDGMVLINKTTEIFKKAPEYNYQVCTSCKVEGCKSCSPSNLSGCLSCNNGLYKQRQEDGATKCVKFHKLNQFRIILITLFLICLIFLIICITIMAKLVSASKKLGRGYKKSKMAKNGSIHLERKVEDFEVGNDEIENFGIEDTPFNRMSSLRNYKVLFQERPKGAGEQTKRAENLSLGRFGGAQYLAEGLQGELEMLKDLKNIDMSKPESRSLLVNLLVKFKGAEKEVGKIREEMKTAVGELERLVQAAERLGNGNDEERVSLIK